MYSVFPFLKEVLVSVKLSKSTSHKKGTLEKYKYLSKLSTTIAKEPYISDGRLYFSIHFGDPEYVPFHEARDTKGVVQSIHSNIVGYIDDHIKETMSGYGIFFNDNVFKVCYSKIIIEYMEVALNIHTKPVPKYKDYTKLYTFYGRVLAQYMIYHESRRVIYNNAKTTPQGEISPIFDVVLNSDMDLKYPNRPKRNVVDCCITKSCIRYYTGFVYEVEDNVENIDGILFSIITAPFNNSIKQEKYLDFFNYAFAYFIEVVLSELSKSLRDRRVSWSLMLPVIIFKNMPALRVFCVDKISKERLFEVLPLLESFIDNYKIKDLELCIFLENVRDIINNRRCMCTYSLYFFKDTSTVANHVLFNAYRNLISVKTSVQQ